MYRFFHLLRGGVWLFLLLPGSIVMAAPLTLKEALHIADRDHPALASAEAQVQGAKAGIETARSYPNPEFEVGSGVSQLQPPTPLRGRNTLIAIAQPLEGLGVRNGRARAAEARHAASVALHAEARLMLHAQVKQAFLEIQRREEEVQLAREGYGLLEQIRNRVKLRVEVGEASRFDLIKAEAEVLMAESQMQSAIIREEQAKERLRSLLALPAEEAIEIVHAEWPSAALPPLAVLRQELLAQHPLLAATTSETRRSEAQLEMERSLRWPQPTLKMSAETHPDVRLWRVGVSFPLPLWNRRSGPVAEAEAGLDRAQAEQERTRLALLSELEQIYGRYLIAQRQLTVFESSLVHQAEAALRVAEAAYRYGERGILEYLDAQRVSRNVHLDYLNARYELQFVLIEIERLRAPLLDGEPQ